VAVAAYDSNDAAKGQEVSGTDGYFMMLNLSTGYYKVKPVLDSGETSGPSQIANTVAAGQTLFIGTFTISGAYGYMTGNVKDGATPIPSGVLVAVTSVTLAAGPPSLSTTTLEGASFYMASSDEDGTYTVPVRGSTYTLYNVYAWYTKFSGSTPNTVRKLHAGYSVTAGSSTYVHFQW